MLKKPKLSIRSFSTLCAFCSYSVLASAYAQVPTLPGSADPSRLEERYRIPSISPDGSAAPKEEAFPDADIPEAIDGFTLEGISLEGMSAYKTEVFDALIAEYVGRDVDLNVLNHLTARLNAAYRKDGYFVSRVIIPAQDVVDGHVRLRIIEGRIGRIIIDDPEQYLANDTFNIIEDTIKKIEKLEILHGPTLERYILLLNDHAGVSIQHILKETSSLKEKGTVDLVLKVVPADRLNSSISFDNYGSRFVGPNQLTGTYTLGGIANTFDTLSVQASTTLPLREAQFGAIHYSLPVNAEGLTAAIDASYSNSEPGLNLRALEVEGDATTISTGLDYPLVRSRSQNITLGSRFLLRNSSTEFLDTELIDDKIRSLSFFARYNHRGTAHSATSANFSVSHGLNILGATRTGSTNLSRLEGRSDFFKINVDASHQREVFPSWTLSGSIATQYAPHPLLSSEEFGYGGVQFGRAYDPSEILGDQGAAASLELLYTGLPNLENQMNLTPFAFYDAGKVWNEDAGISHTSASSAGFGTYYNISNAYNGSLQFAFPLTREIDTPIMNGNNGPRILFNLNRLF